MRFIARRQRPRAIERTELFPAPRGIYSGLLTSQTLNNCIIFHIVKYHELLPYSSDIIILVKRFTLMDKVTEPIECSRFCPCCCKCYRFVLALCCSDEKKRMI